MEMKAVNCMPI